MFKCSCQRERAKRKGAKKFEILFFLSWRIKRQVGQKYVFLSYCSLFFLQIDESLRLAKGENNEIEHGPVYKPKEFTSKYQNTKKKEKQPNFCHFPSRKLIQIAHFRRQEFRPRNYSPGIVFFVSQNASPPFNGIVMSYI